MRLVEVVIPTFNRHARLLRTLASLDRQTFRDFSVTVVDDCSSPPVAGAIPVRLMASLGIRVLTTAGNSGPGAARNLGVGASSAPYIAFIDDDVDAAPLWLETHLVAAESGPEVVTFGPLLAPPGWSPTPWNCWEAETLRREYERMSAGLYAPTWRQFFTGNALVRRERLLRVGGFDERFTRAEDIELGLRMHNAGCRFVFNDQGIGWHHARRTLGSWLRIPREYARFDVAMDRMYPETRLLEVLDRERAERGRGMLAARGLFGSEVRWRAGRGAALMAARLAFAAGRRAEAMRALSMVYDLESGLARIRAATGTQELLANRPVTAA